MRFNAFVSTMSGGGRCLRRTGDVSGPHLRHRGSHVCPGFFAQHTVWHFYFLARMTACTGLPTSADTGMESKLERSVVQYVHQGPANVPRLLRVGASVHDDVPADCRLKVGRE